MESLDQAGLQSACMASVIASICNPVARPIPQTHDTGDAFTVRLVNRYKAPHLRGGFGLISSWEL